MHELVIRGGSVVDGTGGPARTADIAIDGGRITEIGAVDGTGTRELDADGLVVAPGWVDIHTHYDGQVTWDPELTPSSWHGVTTVVMGNCGVGFAPVRPDGKDFLIELMEGVEDIPGSALHEGIDWDWESFPEYLDALDKTPRAIDVATQVPHAALRAYVMGERAHEREANADEIEQMARLAEEGLRAGACGVSTSRTILHSSQHGLVPGTDAPPEELLALGDAIGRAGHGVFQLVSDHQGGAGDRAWLVDLVERTGATATYALAQAGYAPDAWREALAATVEDRAAGRRIIPQVSSRPTGMLFGMQSSLHPFFTHPTYRTVADLPLAERIAKLRQPEIRAALLAEEPQTKNPIARGLMQRWDQIFPLGDPPDYEPPSSASIAGVAARTGRLPQEVALDWLLEDDGKALPLRPAGQLRGPQPRRLPRDDDEPEHDPRPVRRRGALRPDLRRQHAQLPAHPLGQRPIPRRSHRARAGDQPPDVAHRRDLRVHRPRRARRRDAGRHQRDRPRRHGAPRPRDGLRPPRRRPPTDPEGRRLRRHPGRRRGHLRARRAHRRPPRPPGPLLSARQCRSRWRRRGNSAHM